ncbi:MAG: hypothetical protein K2Y27_35220 [Xanthobacteraceae bacterium]|nr:hypothetical protein [Xanthobacteraceae bacterium]
MAKMLGEATRNRIQAVLAACRLQDLLYDVYCNPHSRRRDIGLRIEHFRSASSKADDLRRTLSIMAGTPTAHFEALVHAIEAIELRDWPDVHTANACFRHLREIRDAMWPDYKFTGPLSSISGFQKLPAFKQAFDSLSASPPIAPVQDAAMKESA